MKPNNGAFEDEDPFNEKIIERTKKLAKIFQLTDEVSRPHLLGFQGSTCTDAYTQKRARV